MSKRLDPLLSEVYAAGGVHEFVAVQRRGIRVQVQAQAKAPPVRHVADKHTADVLIYRDVRRGRGSSRLRLDGAERAADERARVRALIAEAAERAAGSLGPAWHLPPPAAPARVDIADANLAQEPMQAVDTVRGQIAELLSPASEITAVLGTDMQVKHLRVTARADEVRVHSSRGFSHRYPDTRLSIDLTMAAAAGVAQTVALRSRRLADLDLDNALLRAARYMRDRHGARVAAPGVYDLLVSENALTPRVVTEMSRVPAAAGGPVWFAWFAPLVAQADARLVRQGLAQYLPGQSVYRGMEPAGDRLTVASDGALPFAPLSQPVGDEGEPVRRFALIEQGVAAGLALDQQEAALRGATANGGVRNLIIDPGTTPVSALRAPAERQVLEAVELDWIEIDTLSGGFIAALGLGYLGTSKGRGAPVTGALVRGNLYDLWARARFADDTITSDWYRGPRAIRFDGAEVL